MVQYQNFLQDLIDAEIKEDQIKDIWAKEVQAGAEKIEEF